MATTTAPPRTGRTKDKPARRQTGQRPRVNAQNAGKRVKSAAVAVSDAPHTPSEIGRKLALQALKAVGRRALESGAETVQRVTEAAAKSGHGAFAAVHRQVPIQRSVDVAVPVAVAWEEWINLSWLPEGVHRVQNVEQDGDDRLRGRIDHSSEPGWEAEILEERERQSFAWQSVTGSDCAGLVTFHRLSDQLTRLELSLDVVPTNLAQALALSTHIADRRAELDLRRFKAQVELINPDLYADDLDPDVAGDRDSDGAA